MWTELWTSIQPMVISLAGTVITTVITVVGVFLRKKLSDESMKLLQDIFQKGIENAAGIALNELSPAELTKTIIASDPAVKKGVEYVKTAVPDTIGKFKLNDFQLAEKIIAKMMVLTAGQPTPTHK